MFFYFVDDCWISSFEDTERKASFVCSIAFESEMLDRQLLAWKEFQEFKAVLKHSRGEYGSIKFTEEYQVLEICVHREYVFGHLRHSSCITL